MKELPEGIKLVSKSVLGSTLYGLSTPKSDIDFGGVFIPTIKDILTNPMLKEIDLSTKTGEAGTRNNEDDEDYKIYALPQFLHLISNNNPNILEQIFVPEEHRVVDTPLMAELRENADKIVSLRSWHTFSGYAFSQKKKLIVKRDRFFQLEKGLNYLAPFSDYQLSESLGEFNASALCKITKTYKSSKHTNKPFKEDLIASMVQEKLQEEYDAYGWRLHTESFDIVGYDTKFAYHLIRLLDEGRQLLETGRIKFPITGDALRDCKAIRDTEVSFEQLMEMYEVYYQKCKYARDNSSLPEECDIEWIKDFQYRHLLEFISNKVYSPRIGWRE